MILPPRVTLCEVGLRDGLQNEAVLLSAEQKMELLRLVEDAGFTTIEAGSFVHPKAVPQMAGTDALYTALRPKPGTVYRALAGNLKGVERAAACGCNRIKLNVSASRGHNLANLNRLPMESIAGFGDCVRFAKEAEIEVSGSISCPFGSPWDPEIPLADVRGLVEAYLALEITEISLSDAAGLANPRQVYELCRLLGREYPRVTWWLHFHNTRGMGLANVLAGLEAGVTRFDASFAGVGGCPFIPGAVGNIATEDTVYMLREMGVETGIDLDKCFNVSRRAEELIGHKGTSCLTALIK